MVIRPGSRGIACHIPALAVKPRSYLPPSPPPFSSSHLHRQIPSAGPLTTTAPPSPTRILFATTVQTRHLTLAAYTSDSDRPIATPISIIPPDYSIFATRAQTVASRSQTRYLVAIATAAPPHLRYTDNKLFSIYCDRQRDGHNVITLGAPVRPAAGADNPPSGRSRRLSSRLSSLALHADRLR